MSPAAPSDLGDDYFSDTITVYMTVHWQRYEGNRWVSYEFTHRADASTLESKQDIMDREAPIIEQIIRQSDGVLVSIEIIAPAFFRYFRGF